MKESEKPGCSHSCCMGFVNFAGWTVFGDTVLLSVFSKCFAFFVSIGKHQLKPKAAFWLVQRRSNGVGRKGGRSRGSDPVFLRTGGGALLDSFKRFNWFLLRCLWPQNAVWLTAVENRAQTKQRSSKASTSISASAEPLSQMLRHCYTENSKIFSSAWVDTYTFNAPHRLLHVFYLYISAIICTCCT